MKRPAPKYPYVHNEFTTVAALHKGASIARFGDGEFKMIVGKGYVREPANRRLGEELNQVLLNAHPACIVGIPTMDPAGPKILSWLSRQPRFIRRVNETKEYYSAFISRPDSAPWIRTEKFARAMQALWKDRHVAAVCERQGGLLRMLGYGAAKITHIECPSEQAYALIDLFEKAVVQLRPQIAFLACGPTATCLANRLAKHGIQAIDFGSGGSFIARLLKP